ncbi:MAG: heavy-metal-associated domain-containing protein [Candidatus Heimdallarchaeota archaeon]|nr:heavy-metal-associated domain-containing protein [Candidatus Heimdallarchaeota archaeon]
MSNKIKMNISGMCCQNCSKAIESSLSKFEFISKIEIDPKSGVAEFDIVGRIEENETTVITAITDLGYKVKD